MPQNNDKVKEYKQFKQIVNTIYNEELQILDDKGLIEKKDVGQIDIEPIIYYDKFTNNMKVEFVIGKKKKHLIKDLTQFYDCFMKKEYFRYSEKLNVLHRREVFTDKSKKIVDFILKYAETIKIANESAQNNVKYHGNILDCSRINIFHSSLDDLFDILNGQKVIFHSEGKASEIEFIDQNPQIQFILTKAKYVNEETKKDKIVQYISSFSDSLLDRDEKEDEILKNYNERENHIVETNETLNDSNDEYVLMPNIEIFKLKILQGKNYKYILKKNKLFRCSKNFEKTNLMLLELFRNNFVSQVKLGKDELTQFFSIIVPKVKNAIKIQNINLDELKPYIPKDLITKVFLDINSKNYLTVEIRFCYGDIEFNPLNEKNTPQIARNIITETKYLNIFKKIGFLFDAKSFRFVLTDDEKIYNFLINDIKTFTKRFEVSVTENFRQKQIITPKIDVINVELLANELKVTLEDFNIPFDNIKEIITIFQDNKKFYRFPNGQFIELRGNKQIEFLEKIATGMEVKVSELKTRTIRVPVYRALYLNELLKTLQNTQIYRNAEFKNLIKHFEEDNIEDQYLIPQKYEEILRIYQKTGFKWLKTIDEYRYGGILADDMGLGKTIQIISILEDYVDRANKKNNKSASLVISPSSLILNWQSEIFKFAPDLKVLVIRGSIEDRKKQIYSIDNYDIVITSYDLLKRDIEIYKKFDYEFRYVIADEAQYLKNSNTQNAKTIKEIKAQTRFALTGTPMENALSEIWSIFDFIMPGYLFDYKRFKALYEIPIARDDKVVVMNKLKLLIKPFILRRTKKEVLTELPEKTITILKNQMGDIQDDIYCEYLAQAKQEISDLIDNDGIKNSQIKILAALTRLRQICCHPKLFLDSYEGESAKLEQCIEIISDAVASGHKILLFSSYTSMFDIIKKRLDELEINSYTLTGNTKIDERIELVDDFNENPDVKVFLISLKAGGTGLNLTGADTIIHYDPWWNLSAENQATDRAYRIGQKNSVQVYKLITKNTIEEKIYELQQKKAHLIDNMLDNENILVNKLSKDDILSLFT